LYHICLNKDRIVIDLVTELYTDGLIYQISCYIADIASILG